MARFLEKKRKTLSAPKEGNLLSEKIFGVLDLEQSISEFLTITDMDSLMYTSKSLLPLMRIRMQERAHKVAKKFNVLNSSIEVMRKCQWLPSSQFELCDGEFVLFVRPVDENRMTVFALADTEFEIELQEFQLKNLNTKALLPSKWGKGRTVTHERVEKKLAEAILLRHEVFVGYYPSYSKNEWHTTVADSKFSCYDVFLNSLVYFRLECYDLEGIPFSKNRALGWDEDVSSIYRRMERRCYEEPSGFIGVHNDLVDDNLNKVPNYGYVHRKGLYHVIFLTQFSII